MDTSPRGHDGSITGDVLKNSGETETFLNDYGIRNIKKDVPSFEDGSVWLAVKGTPETGGHSIKITEISKQGDEIVVTVTHTKPSGKGFVTQATDPQMHILKVSKEIAQAILGTPPARVKFVDKTTGDIIPPSKQPTQQERNAFRQRKIKASENIIRNLEKQLVGIKLLTKIFKDKKTQDKLAKQIDGLVKAIKARKEIYCGLSGFSMCNSGVDWIYNTQEGQCKVSRRYGGCNEYLPADPTTVRGT